MPSPRQLLLLEDSDSLAIHFGHLFGDFKKSERLTLANSRPPSALVNSGCHVVISCRKLFSTQRKQRVVKTLLRTSSWKQKPREGPGEWTRIPLHPLLCSHIVRLHGALGISCGKGVPQGLGIPSEQTQVCLTPFLSLD